MKTAIGIVAFNRPQYLSQLLNSIENQTDYLGKYDFFIFVDGSYNPISGNTYYDKELVHREIKDIVDNFNARNPVHITVSYAERNYGPAVYIYELQRHLFDTLGYDRVITLEEDLVVSAHYLKLLSRLLDKHAQDERVGFVYSPAISGTIYANYGMWKRSWDVITDELKEYAEFMGQFDYSKRPADRVTERYHFGTQDMARKKFFEKHGMETAKLSRSKVQHIGRNGLHYTEEEFVKKDFHSQTLSEVVDIIVPVYNNGELTEKCLDSLIANTTADHRIIVLDNGSDQETRDILAQDKYRDILFVTHEKNEGWIGGVNHALEFCDNEYIVLLNNDTEVPEHWLEDLLAALHSDETLAAVGPRTDNGIQHASTVDPEGKQIVYPKMIAFFCTLFHRKVFDELGFLDTDFENGLCEDDYFCALIKNKGWRVGIVPWVTVKHVHRATFSKMENEAWGELYKRNRAILDKKLAQLKNT